MLTTSRTSTPAPANSIAPQLSARLNLHHRPVLRADHPDAQQQRLPPRNPQPQPVMAILFPAPPPPSINAAYNFVVYRHK